MEVKQLSDIDVPAQLAYVNLKESDIQSKCVDWARRRGYWARKFSSISQRSVPDFLFAGRGIKFAIEFKRPGNTSTPAQIDEQKAMRAAGWTVFECSDFEIFKSMVSGLEKGEWL